MTGKTLKIRDRLLSCRETSRNPKLMEATENRKTREDPREKKMEYLPMQSLRICSLFSHFLTNRPGSTSSVRQLDFTTLLVEHRSSPDLGFRLTSSPKPRPEANESDGSSSSHVHAMLAFARPTALFLPFVFNPPKETPNTELDPDTCRLLLEVASPITERVCDKAGLHQGLAACGLIWISTNLPNLAANHDDLGVK